MTRAADTSTQALPLRLFKNVAGSAESKELQTQLQLIEEELLTQLRFASPVADAATRYLAAAGGKRIRPMLTLLVSQLNQGPNHMVRLAAQAIEITHLASLYHDDVMDDAPLRRGVASAQTVWSNSVAILAGDLLFARASSLVSGMGEAAVLLQAKTFERLCLGQLHETIGPQPGEAPIEHYLQVLADKTGALIATAAKLGAMFSGADETTTAAVAEYGERVGVAFQLIDDVIDLSPKQQQTGKIAGTDLRAGVATLPLLLLRERGATGDAAALELLQRIDAGVAKIAAGAPLTVMDAEVAQLRNHPVTAATQQLAEQWAAQAVAALAPLPASNAKKALQRMAKLIVRRNG